MVANSLQGPTTLQRVSFLTCNVSYKSSLILVSVVLLYFYINKCIVQLRNILLILKNFFNKSTFGKVYSHTIKHFVMKSSEFYLICTTLLQISCKPLPNVNKHFKVNDSIQR